MAAELNSFNHNDTFIFHFCNNHPSPSFFPRLFSLSQALTWDLNSFFVAPEDSCNEQDVPGFA